MAIQTRGSALTTGELLIQECCVGSFLAFGFCEMQNKTSFANHRFYLKLFVGLFNPEDVVGMLYSFGASRYLFPHV